MTGAGIHSGDMLIVDRSIEAVNGKIVIAAIDGELTVKRLSRENNRIQLLPSNPNYPPILKNTGIPTSIGLGSTKTLAKISNHICKKELKIPVFNITYLNQDFIIKKLGYA